MHTHTSGMVLVPIAHLNDYLSLCGMWFVVCECIANLGIYTATWMHRVPLHLYGYGIVYYITITFNTKKEALGKPCYAQWHLVPQKAITL